MLNKKDTKICLKAEQIKRHGSVSQYFPKPKSLEANAREKAGIQFNNTPLVEKRNKFHNKNCKWLLRI